MSLRTARAQAKAKASLVVEFREEYRALYADEIRMDGSYPRSRAQARAVTRLTKAHPDRWRQLYEEAKQ